MLYFPREKFFSAPPKPVSTPNYTSSSVSATLLTIVYDLFEDLFLWFAVENTCNPSFKMLMAAKLSSFFIQRNFPCFTQKNLPGNIFDDAFGDSFSDVEKARKLLNGLKYKFNDSINQEVRDYILSLLEISNRSISPRTKGLSFDCRTHEGLFSQLVKKENPHSDRLLIIIHRLCSDLQLWFMDRSPDDVSFLAGMAAKLAEFFLQRDLLGDLGSLNDTQKAYQLLIALFYNINQISNLDIRFDIFYLLLVAEVKKIKKEIKEEALNFLFNDVKTHLLFLACLEIRDQTFLSNKLIELQLTASQPCVFDTDSKKNQILYFRIDCLILAFQLPTQPEQKSKIAGHLIGILSQSHTNDFQLVLEELKGSKQWMEMNEEHQANLLCFLAKHWIPQKTSNLHDLIKTITLTLKSTISDLKRVVHTLEKIKENLSINTERNISICSALSEAIIELSFEIDQLPLPLENPNSYLDFTQAKEDSVRSSETSPPAAPSSVEPLPFIPPLSFIYFPKFENVLEITYDLLEDLSLWFAAQADSLPFFKEQLAVTLGAFFIVRNFPGDLKKAEKIFNLPFLQPENITHVDIQRSIVFFREKLQENKRGCQLRLSRELSKIEFANLLQIIHAQQKNPGPLSDNLPPIINHLCNSLFLCFTAPERVSHLTYKIKMVTLLAAFFIERGAYLSGLDQTVKYQKAYVLLSPLLSQLDTIKDVEITFHVLYLLIITQIKQTEVEDSHEVVQSHFKTIKLQLSQLAHLEVKNIHLLSKILIELKQLMMQSHALSSEPKSILRFDLAAYSLSLALRLRTHPRQVRHIIHDFIELLQIDQKKTLPSQDFEITITALKQLEMWRDMEENDRADLLYLLAYYWIQDKTKSFHFRLLVNTIQSELESQIVNRRVVADTLEKIKKTLSRYIEGHKIHNTLANQNLLEQLSKEVNRLFNPNTIE
jgi:hypothetical protein